MHYYRLSAWMSFCFVCFLSISFLSLLCIVSFPSTFNKFLFAYLLISPDRHARYVWWQLSSEVTFAVPGKHIMHKYYITLHYIYIYIVVCILQLRFIKVTDDFRLLLNDVDATPLVSRASNHLIKCGHREIRRDSTLFVPPEQLWPFPDQPFKWVAKPVAHDNGWLECLALAHTHTHTHVLQIGSVSTRVALNKSNTWLTNYATFSDDIMPPYCEKTDIWKLPFVLEHFLGESQYMYMRVRVCVSTFLILLTVNPPSWCRRYVNQRVSPVCYSIDVCALIYNTSTHIHSLKTLTSSCSFSHACLSSAGWNSLAVSANRPPHAPITVVAHTNFVSTLCRGAQHSLCRVIDPLRSLSCLWCLCDAV